MKFTLAKISRQDVLLALVSFLIGLVLYILTLAPGLLYGDSAEFQTLAYTLGMTHPTGYPVYLLLAKLFVTVLPISTIAYRINLLSAVFAASALACIYLTGRMLAYRRLAAIAAVLALSLVDIFWFHAIIAELYAAAAAFIAAIILLLLLWQQRGDDRYLFVAGLLGGLSLGVHSTVALIAPAVLIYLAVSSRRWRTWLSAASGALLGVFLALAAFLTLDALNAPSGYYNSVARPSLSIWGMTPADFDVPYERLAFLYAARQFRGFIFSAPLSAALEKAGLYFSHIHWVSLVLFVLGLIALFRRVWKEALLLLLSWIIMLAFVLNYDIWDVQVFFIPTFIPLFIVIAVGLGVLVDCLAWIISHLATTYRAKWLSKCITSLLVILLVASTFPDVSQSLRLGYPAFLGDFGEEYPYPYSNPDLPHARALAVLNQLEDSAIVFTGWDMLYVYYYVAHVEQGRTGIAFHEIYPQDGVEELAASARDYIDANLGQRPVYITDEVFEFKKYYSVEQVDRWLSLYRLIPGS